MSLSSLSLFAATPEQVVESRRRTAASWAVGYTLEQYLERDAIMDKCEHAAGGKLLTWVLAPRSDPATLDFMCSCETFRRTAVVAKRAKEVDAREVREVTAYGVASVYTPPEKRGKGYARHMMRLLHWVLAPRSALPSEFPGEWGAPPDADVLRLLGVANAQFSVLYSDVGPAFYQGCGPTPSGNDGWVMKGALETSRMLADASAEPIPARSPPPPSGLNLHRLTEEDVLALYARDAAWIKDDLASFAGDTSRTLFSFLPDRGVGAFVMRRVMDFEDGPEPRPVRPAGRRWGVAILPRGARDVQAALRDAQGPFPFVTWTLDVRASPRALVVARLRADEHAFPVLLEQLLAAAREERMDRVEFWYLRPELRAVAHARGWATRERAEHLSAVKGYGDEEDDGLEWVYNEKFCWC